MKSSHSIILTVHNKDWLVDQVIQGILTNTQGNYELIVVLDGCSDQSQDVTIKTLSQNPAVKTTIIHAPDVFETRANNMGLKIATGDQVIIVQDDQIVAEPGWNLRMLKPLQQFSDVFAVSANCAHNWMINPHSQDLHLDHDPDDHMSDICIDCDHAYRDNVGRDLFAIRNTVNRGPLMIDHLVLEKLNYLDEQFAPQDMDDHDLTHRAYKMMGKLCGFYDVRFVCEKVWGGTRSNGQPKPWLLRSNQKNMRIFYQRHQDIINQRHDQIRICP
jgi:glycosyltransferase involved in cell wall biosynthesis